MDGTASFRSDLLHKAGGFHSGMAVFTVGEGDEDRRPERVPGVFPKGGHQTVKVSKK